MDIQKIFQHVLLILNRLTTQSRMFLVLSFFGVFAVSIVFSLARYTLFDHDFYKKLADSQQLREVELAVNR